MDCVDSGQRPAVKQSNLVRRFISDDRGQDVIEYALIAAFIGIAGILALRGIQSAVGTTYSSWTDPGSGTPSLWEPAEPPAP
jgi:pilus assembly protein Flp/PilA